MHRLREVSRFEFTATCRKIPPSYETRTGKGEVIIQNQNQESITYFEKGKWNSLTVDLTPVGQGELGYLECEMNVK